MSWLDRLKFFLLDSLVCFFTFGTERVVGILECQECGEHYTTDDPDHVCPTLQFLVDKDREIN